MFRFATVFAAFVLLVSLPAAAAAADDDAGKKKAPGDEREVLSTHETIAVYRGVTFRRCRGLTADCPDRCGHSGDFAAFAVKGYLAYEKPGEYGDPKAEEYVFQVSDNHGAAKVDKDLAARVTALKAGDWVRLDWRHDYVTRTEPGGGVSKFPDRVVTRLEKVTQAEGEKALKDAAVSK